MPPAIESSHIFLYVTEKCNLACRYCYFRDKRNRSLSLETIRGFIFFLEKEGMKPRRFILSGGEPLLVWPLTKKVISFLKTAVPKAEIGLQTNGLLLDAPKIAFLKTNKVNLEIGLDGLPATTSAWRRGTTNASFAHLVEMLLLCRLAGLAVNCNMTVHPQEMPRFRHNFLFLAQLPFGKIDVTPAAFAAWDQAGRRTFKQDYAWIAKKYHAKIYAGDARRFSPQGAWDLSLHPHGYLLPGDAFLCLPEKLKQEFSLIQFSPQPRLNTKTLAMLKQLYQRFGRKEKKQTYRDYIVSSFKIVNDLTGKTGIDWKAFEELFDFMTRVNRQDPSETKKGQTNGGRIGE
ncbi:MAG: radical SAM protein [Candidatus Velamenicoccus archaeovorus]